MCLNKQLSESISRGINLAIDDFDDNMSVDVQKLGNIENLSVTQDILKFKRISKLLDEKYFEKISKDDYEWMSEMHKKLKLSYDAGRDHMHLNKLVNFIGKINKCTDLNWINTSAITDMSNLFANSEFDGDISEWNTSNVTNMFAMFDDSQFNGDISKWNVSKVENMRFMFADSQFNGDISNWDVHNVKDMKYMFAFSQFTGDISKWDVSKVEKHRDIFFKSPIKEQNKPKFNIFESIQHGINLAIDDFDDFNDTETQKTGQIKHSLSTRELIKDKYFVDLGLPSGTCWAKYNIGVDSNKLNKAQDWYGEYYAWGEIEEKQKYVWETYKYASDFDKLTKYCSKLSYLDLDKNSKLDNLTVLQDEDDAIIQTNKFPQNVKMPTREQIVELIEYTTSEWVKNYQEISGLNGRIFTGKQNGNVLFIPAAGYLTGSSVSSVGSQCLLWSRSLDQVVPHYAQCLYFSQLGCSLGEDYRCNGFSVRAVLNNI